MDRPPQRYVCIHGHFYQPPRENPWLEHIEVQDSAYPYHDWNERVMAECYAPNTASRILDADFKIIDIVNNYSKISFNFGPTLLSWIQNKDPEVMEAIVEADKKSQETFSGHGSAIAQAYNHIIMPLASSRDKKTQVIWGIRDFEYRFGRKPEGMWLPETAVDLESLDVMAQQGIKFTILAPRQARLIREIGDVDWADVSGEKVDTKKAYLCNLPSGRSIHLFFYDGAVAGDIAFGNLLSSGESFASRIVNAFSGDGGPQIVHLATDGETYGHHYKGADMALAYCLYDLETKGLARITVYGEFLEKHPPTHEVQIFENTSWSCEHGVQRWRSDCGCNTHPGWHQKWRAPLREAMDWLRDLLVPVYEKEMGRFVNDPWEVRNAYIDVILNREDDNISRFLNRYSKRELTSEEKIQFLSLLEMQRNTMLMYTSCGWFFDDISGLETTQVLAYASRAIQLAEKISRISLEAAYLEKLKGAPTNIPEFVNGARIYEIFVKPARLDLFRVVAHYAVSSLYSEYPENFSLYCYKARSLKFRLEEAGRLKLAVGSTHIRSDLTWSEKQISFAVLNLGDYNISGGVREYTGEEEYCRMYEEIRNAFLKIDIPGTIRLIDKHFQTHEYSLWNLFRDEQRRIIHLILSSTLENIESSFRQIFEANYQFMSLMVSMRNPLPKALATTVEFVLNRDLRELLEKEDIDINDLSRQIDEVKKWPVEIDKAGLDLIVGKAILNRAKKMATSPLDISLWKGIENLIRLLKSLDIDVDLWETQNIYFRIGKKHYDEMQQRSESDPQAKEWTGYFIRLGDVLGVRFK
ncbi:MAG: DUF3536 domain-containing protein [Syntrophales bacterium]